MICIKCGTKTSTPLCERCERGIARETAQEMVREYYRSKGVKDVIEDTVSRDFRNVGHCGVYTAIVSYTDQCCVRGKCNAHVMFERIEASSSRDAMKVAMRRSRKLQVGDVVIVRGNLPVTGRVGNNKNNDVGNNKNNNVDWTVEETQTRNLSC